MGMKREDRGTRTVSGSDSEQEQVREDQGHVPGPKAGMPGTGATTTPQQSTAGMEGGAGIGQGAIGGPSRDKGHHKHNPDT
jgi:hypothetical protein